jgi:hypothetical protein
MPDVHRFGFGHVGQEIPARSTATVDQTALRETEGRFFYVLLEWGLFRHPHSHFGKAALKSAG